ncbi:MAG TPA: glycoside hydrolase family 78 protein [Pelobium sp.]|nr:glycoside hydrolase family 78 protein [Pelobium sp.]
MTKKFIIFFLLVFGFSHLKAQDLQVTALKVEQLVNPLGIDVKQPNLSWQIVSQKRGVMQTAYQVLVSSSAEKLAQNEGDLWNSGKVNSSESIYVKYNGKELTSRTKCFWKVKIWTNVGESEWSENQFWTMGLLYYKDWPKTWIGFDRAFPWDSIENASRLSARYFRKEFESKKTVKSATASIAGLGLYELFINGKKVGDDVLAPSPTDYTQNVKANTYDVTSYIQNGKNAVGAVLGNGRFFAMRQNEKPYKIKTFGFPKMLLNIHIVYTDGSTANIDTDNSWKGTADGPIRTNNEYDGEEYDATKELTDWNKIGFDDSKWLQAEYVQEPSGTIEAQMNENMKVMKTLQPVSITKLSRGRYILDMGQNMVGWLQIKVKGKKGQQIKLRFAESLEDNGELFTANLRNAKNTDLYTLKGGEEEIWEPTFVYRGFRFVELSGYNYQPKVADFVGKMVYDNIETVGTFESSNPLLNQIFKNAWWGIAGNYKGMPLDCPQRNERMPWLGDRGEVAYGENFLFDNERIYTKWLEDIRNSQKEDGAIPDVAPAFWRYYSDNMTWAGTVVSITDMLYKQTGDVQVVKDNYPAIKKWLTYMQDRYMENYIMTKDSYGDWCAPPVTIEAGRGKSADKKYPSQLISTAYHYHFLHLMMEYSKLTGNENDYNQFETLATKVKDAFNKKFYNDKGFYGDNKLTDNIIPLYFGMVPKAETDKVFKNIVYTVEVTNNGHLSNGLVGVQWLMRCLNDYGRPDLAYRIATQKTYPSWGYMIENGATTIWELWNGNTAHPRMNSQNHVMMLGDLLIWYYENLAGIKAGTPGFKKIIMKPETVAGLNYVNASFDSPYGKIKSNWKKDSKSFSWNITVPANTSAEVYLPASNQKSIKENNKNITNAEGVEFIRQEGDRVVYKVNSGNYAFQIK